MNWWSAWRMAWGFEWGLLRRHPKLAAAAAGLCLVPALYAWIYLSAVWDPQSHRQALRVGLVNLDRGARFGERDANLGQDMLAALEREPPFTFERYADAEQARRDVRRGRLAFALQIPPDFSTQALPGERPGAAKLVLYLSEGNDYGNASVARAFAPEMAKRVNTMLAEARWALVLSSAEGTQRNLETLRGALADVQHATAELKAGLQRARDGGATLVGGAAGVLDAAQRVQGGASQLAAAAPQLAGRLRQVGPVLKGLNAQRGGGGGGGDGDLLSLRVASRQLTDGHRELMRGIDALLSGAQALDAGLAQYALTAGEVPLFGQGLSEGMAPIRQGSRQLADGLGTARDGSQRLAQGMQKLDEAVGALTEAVQRATNAMTLLAMRLPDDQRLDGFVDGVRDLARGNEGLVGGVRQLSQGQGVLQNGLARLADGATRLDAALEAVRRGLPAALQAPGGSASGLALSVEPVVEAAAPVAGYGAALVPNFVPVALWIGAVMAGLLVHWRRMAEPLSAAPASAVVAAKLTLPLAAVLIQAVLTLLALAFVLRVPVAQPWALVGTVLACSVCFLLTVVALVRVLGDLGKVLAIVLLVVQVSSAGAVLSLELSDEWHRAVSPFLPLTWAVRAFKASLFGAFDGDWATPLGVVGLFAAAALVLGLVVGRLRPVPVSEWRPPLDID